MVVVVAFCGIRALNIGCWLAAHRTRNWILGVSMNYNEVSAGSSVA